MIYFYINMGNKDHKAEKVYTAREVALMLDKFITGLGEIPGCDVHPIILEYESAGAFDRAINAEYSALSAAYCDDDTSD